MHAKLHFNRTVQLPSGGYGNTITHHPVYRVEVAEGNTKLRLTVPGGHVTYELKTIEKIECWFDGQ